MPNRIIKETICTSDTIDCLSPFCEVVFYRLIVNCDDFGRFDARPKVLSSKLFPLKDITTEQMQEAINTLCDVGLITVYEVDGRPYLQMNTWDKHQTKRAKKSKYPSPDEGTCTHLQADESKCMQMSPYSYSLYENRYSNAHARESNHDNVFADGVEDDSRPDLNTLEVYAANNIMNMHGGNLEKLIAYKDKLPDDLIRFGIDQANKYCKTGVPTFGYLETILRGYIKCGFKTVEQAESAEAARQTNRGARSSPRPQPEQPSGPFF